MTWAQRLKRVFNIDMPQGTLSRRFAPIHLVEVCSLCGGSIRVIACIEEPERRRVRCRFSLARIPGQQHPTSKEARETAWPERLRALVQD